MIINIFCYYYNNFIYNNPTEDQLNDSINECDHYLFIMILLFCPFAFCFFSKKNETIKKSICYICCIVNASYPYDFLILKIFLGVISMLFDNFYMFIMIITFSIFINKMIGFILLMKIICIYFCLCIEKNNEEKKNNNIQNITKQFFENSQQNLTITPQKNPYLACSTKCDQIIKEINTKYMVYRYRRHKGLGKFIELYFQLHYYITRYIVFSH